MEEAGEADERFQVVFWHNGSAYELGLFVTREESIRVADILTIKDALDAGEDIYSLPLQYPLHSYGIEHDANLEEIQSASFDQVVMDLQSCCTNQLPPPSGDT